MHDLEYICCECGKSKNDYDSRYALKTKDDDSEKICWECTSIHHIKRDIKVGYRKIDRELKRIRKYQAELLQLKA